MQEVLPEMKGKWTVLYQKEWSTIKGKSSRSVACQQVREWGGEGGLRELALCQTAGVCQLWFLYIFSVGLNPS